jgi:ribosomal protein S18 acetylase RimI-like enzyme
MTPSERYRQVAALHAANIDQGFLSTLGEPFLAQMYRALDEAEGSVLLTEEQDGRVVGFVSGAAGMGPIYRRMLRRPVRLGASLLPSLVRPARLKRIIEILRYSGRADANQPLPHAELLSIAVDRSARGTGVAERLYRRLQAHFAAHGIDAFRITVGDSLAPAHRYYRKMGAMPVGRIEVHAGEGSVVYVQASEA